MSNKAAEHLSSDKCVGHIQSGPRKGEPCGRSPIKGSNVCSTHGGQLPRVKAAAQFRLARDAAQQEALKRLKERGASRTDTITEMDRLAAEVIVFKDICRERLTELLAVPDGIRYQGQTGEQLRAEVALYERALDRCNTVLATNHKLGIADKRVELQKSEAILVMGLMRNVLNRLDLTPDQKRTAVQVVPQEMRAISSALTDSEVADAELA